MVQNVEAVAAEYAAARDAGNFDVAAVFAGGGVGLIHDIPPAAEIVERIAREADQILSGQRNFPGSAARGELTLIRSETTNMWPDRRLIDLFKTEFPIVLAPMAGVMDADLVIAAAQGGGAGLAALRDALAGEGARAGQDHPSAVSAPVNLNFFCHQAVDADPAREARWRKRLAPYYRELRPRSGGADQCRQPRAVRRGLLRGRRGAEAGDRQLPFRPAGAAPAGAGQGGRLQS